MLTIVVTGSDHQPMRSTFTEREITFGRVAGNHVVLPDRNISRRHARLVVKDGKNILVDLKSTNGTYVNGRRLTTPLVIGARDHIRIGNFTIAIEEADLEITKERPLAPFIPRDRREADLLIAIAANDEPSREVYADWLEEHGHHREAEFLRVQQELVATDIEAQRFRPLSQRLRELAPSVDFRWRVRVARPAIEKCGAQPQFDFRCPKEWGGLQQTEREDTRFCTACAKHVHYCTSVPEARDHAARGECVALDLRVTRWAADLEGPYGVEMCPSCKSDVGDVPSGSCPRCGEQLRYMTVGMMA